MKRYQMIHAVMSPVTIPWRLGTALALPLVALGLFLAVMSQATSSQATAVTIGSMSEAFPIITTDGDQHVPTLAYSNPTDNKYLMVYTDAGDVAALRLQADGTPVGDPFVVEAAVNRDEVAVTFNAQTGEYLVVWRQVVEGFDASVYGRRVSTAGGLLGDRIDVAVRPGRQLNPAVVACGNTYLVVWQEDEDVAWPWLFYIFGQQVSGDGQPISETVRISADPGFQQVDSDIVYNGQQNECLVVFRDARNHVQGSGYNDDIYGQRVSCAGEPMLEDDLPISTQYSESPGGNVQDEPAVAYDSCRDRYLVAWRDQRNDPDASTGPDYCDIYGQLLAADGTPVGTLADENFSIAVADDDQQLPDVAYSLQAQEYLVVWEDHRGDDADIYARRVSDSGALLGEEIIVSNASGNQLTPAVAYSEATGAYLIVWRDDRNQTTSGADIYGCLYQPPPLYKLYLPLIHKEI